MPDSNEGAVTTIGSAITTAFNLRDTIARIEADHKEQLRPYVESLASYEAFILKYLQESGLQNTKVDGVGTCYLREQDSVSVEDWNVTLPFILQSGNYEYFERKVNKTAALAYQSTTGQVVPGTKYSSMYKVGFNKAR